MSKYEDYNATCNSYDGNRQPLGADVVAAMIQVHCKRPLKNIHLLDAGCGTGNYAKALIGYGVGKVTLLDASSGMLEKARVKLAEAIADNTVVDTVEYKLPKIPFDNDTFDVVLFSVVLHHLNPGTGKDDDQHFGELELAIVEARRVVRQDGIIIIIASTADDILNTWYYHINKGITERFVKKFASVNCYLDIFKRVGVKCVQKMRLLGSVLVDYLNPEGPFDKTWRIAILIGQSQMKMK
ncbi:malonyl-[acyl-carrier protein] O-methyltransferase-like [Mercenaria mercenaria]|uniref:malonyl-[acyl-carrier protein] O-methyltransferase-like n=1 Tax=Mercenaria mercenaria TaxID=6596 RepID=UPI00234ED59E|nr:malonyl-[acyl-carrier protein] O-methyltransferase-like [Mercenaria mercenaria]